MGVAFFSWASFDGRSLETSLLLLSVLLFPLSYVRSCTDPGEKEKLVSSLLPHMQPPESKIPVLNAEHFVPVAQSHPPPHLLQYPEYF